MKATLTTLSILVTTSLATAQAAWTEVFPTTVPTGRSGIVGCSDLTGMLVFGGKNASFQNQLYRYDALTGDWTNMAPTGTLPSARNNYAAAYDLARSVLVVYGGDAGGTANANINGETWEWSAVTNTWANRTPAVPIYGTNTPPQLSLSRMVYDALHGHCVLFGGKGNSTTAPVETNETWTWDGTTWTKLLPANSPPARRSGMMAYNSSNGTSLVWGGVSTTGGTVYHGDTWLWDGTNWMQIPTATVPFANATYAAAQLCDLVYDRLRDRFVLSSGIYTGTLPTPSDTWEFDGGDWVNRGPSGGPAGRYSQATAYVEAASKTIQFGGYSYTLGGIFLNRTFEYQTSSVASFTMQPGGCAGSAGVPSLHAATLPWLGDAHQLEVTNAPPNSLHLLALALNTTQFSLAPFGYPGCTAEILPATTMVMLGNPGTGNPTAVIQLPNNPVFAGITLRSQVLSLDPTSQLSLTGRGDSVIGLR